jgi:hypothetical protein
MTRQALVVERETKFWQCELTEPMSQSMSDVFSPWVKIQERADS